MSVASEAPFMPRLLSPFSVFISSRSAAKIETTMQSSPGLTLAGIRSIYSYIFCTGVLRRYDTHGTRTLTFYIDVHVTRYSKYNTSKYGSAVGSIIWARYLYTPSIMTEKREQQTTDERHEPAFNPHRRSVLTSTKGEICHARTVGFQWFC